MVQSLSRTIFILSFQTTPLTQSPSSNPPLPMNNLAFGTLSAVYSFICPLMGLECIHYALGTINKKLDSLETKVFEHILPSALGKIICHFIHMTYRLSRAASARYLHVRAARCSLDLKPWVKLCSGSILGCGGHGILLLLDVAPCGKMNAACASIAFVPRPSWSAKCIHVDVAISLYHSRVVR